MEATYRLRSRYLNGGAPTHCAFCNTPFTDHAYRGSDDRYCCNDFCALDAEGRSIEQRARRAH